MAYNFNTYLNHIDTDFWRHLCVTEGTLCHYERGEEFVREGEVARWIGYIQSGTLKYVVCSDDGTEHVVGMEFDGEFVADFPFSLDGIKARVSIVAVTPCEIYRFPVKEITRMMKADAGIRDIVARSAEAVFSTVYDRYIDLYCKTQRQRYEDLVNSHSEIFTQFSLKDIASFLNITPTHLSRLRKK